MVRIGINGFGRMGRLALRAGWDKHNLEFKRLNEIKGDAATAAHLLTFDSVHGRWREDCHTLDQQVAIGERVLAYTANASIEDTDWSDCDIVIEATGVHHKTPDRLEAYLAQGVKKVLVAAPTEGALNLVYGVNHDQYNAAKHAIVTAASCTTNCLAPVVKVMHEQIGIVHGTMTTIHDLTNTQTIIDKAHKDLRRARAGSLNLIPTSTGSAKAITNIFPALEGKLNGLAVRVSLLNASLTDFVFEAARPVTAEEVNGYFEMAASDGLAGILGYETRPLVSTDYTNDLRSAIVDAPSTRVIDSTLVKVYAWYDNEWGYVCRMVDILSLLARSL
ncbi:MAG: ArsJ-associated glyceraldehyde-3-phosphate dehydrogenase [Gammaproteobacteria bacterium]|nr:ArsJ-associated glyceraldehyde-3-phosphate dehydrogenase [Gammaproteobacteria bacterium]